VDFRDDVVLSSDILTHLSEAYRKLRNTLRYCLGNLYDFDLRKDLASGNKLEEIDAWALLRTAELLERVQAAYEEQAFHKVYRAIYDFSTVDLSAFYFDVLKDRLYTAPAGSTRRRAAQSTLYRIADALVRAVAPVLCFTAEEVWSHLPAVTALAERRQAETAGTAGREASVHLAKFTNPDDLRAGIPVQYVKRMENWPRLMAVRNEVLKALEVARQEKFIRSPLEARVRLAADGDLRTLLESYRAELASLFIVSQVELEPDSMAGAPESGLPGLKVRIEKAAGQKCARCWNYSERVGEDPRYPTVCERCSAALKEIENEK
jgi:isoleucyl-tRNA synthetase